jgi:hypothetical protein
MHNYVDCILKGNLKEAKENITNRIEELVEQKLNQLKMRLATEMCGDIWQEIDEDDELYEDVEDIENISEANIQKMGRTKMVHVRIRKGKVQRRKKFSNVKGFTIRGGKMVRMSAMERRHRKMAARKAKIKSRSKIKQTVRKRNMSLRRRKAMGIK